MSETRDATSPAKLLQECWRVILQRLPVHTGPMADLDAWRRAAEPEVGRLIAQGSWDQVRAVAPGRPAALDMAAED